MRKFLKNIEAKVKVSTIVFLVIVVVLSSMFVLIPETSVKAGSGDFVSWEFYKMCTVNNPNNSYVMEINITKTSGGDVNCSSHCQDDFGDVRFADIDDNTSLDFWIETSSSGNYANMYVETPSDIESDGSIVLWYNTTGTSTTTSSGPNTFLYFETGENVSDWYAFTNPGSGAVSQDGDWIKFASTADGSKIEWRLNESFTYNHTSHFQIEFDFKKVFDVNDANWQFQMYPEDDSFIPTDWTSLYVVAIRDDLDDNVATYNGTDYQVFEDPYVTGTEMDMIVKVNFTTDLAGFWLNGGVEGWYTMREDTEIDYLSAWYTTLDDHDEAYLKNLRTRPWTTGTEPSWSFGEELGEDVSSFSLTNLDGNSRITWSGETGEIVWSNATSYGTLELNYNIAPSDNCTEIRVNLTDIDAGEGILATNISLVFDDNNASFDTTGVVYSGTNVTINQSVWDAQSWCTGTNPFPLDGGASWENGTIYVRFKLSIPGAASSGTYTQDDFYVWWKVEE